MLSDTFENSFKALTEYEPHPWQRRLYDEFIKGNYPPVLDIPTGLGKTSIMTIWFLAHANPNAKKVPRRLVYIVDRRVIVDQASEDAKKLLKFSDQYLKHLTISTLRGGGGVMKGGEWWKSPEHPAIIVGTVDMIGSRLFFSGYGASRYWRPVYAGLLGQDSLIILDEAHISTAMESALRDMQLMTKNSQIYPSRIICMSATPKASNNGVFGLNQDDQASDKVKKQINACKTLSLCEVAESKEINNKMVSLVGEMSGKILIYRKSPKDAKKIADCLKNSHNIALLTGTIRGYERDRLMDNPVFKMFHNKGRGTKNCSTDLTPAGKSRPDPGTKYILVSTSAGEVGVDLDADHMICDLVPLDSLIQRLGRLNRKGERNESKCAVLCPLDELREKQKRLDVEWKKIDEKLEKNWKKIDDKKGTDGVEKDRLRKKENSKAKWEKRVSQITRKDLNTYDCLKQLTEPGSFDASPANLRLHIPEDTDLVFSDAVDTQPLTSDIVDMWAMTSIPATEYKSRPAVKWWLRGNERQPPDAYMAWRWDVEYMVKLPLQRIEEVLRRHRLRPHEIVRANPETMLDMLRQAKQDTQIIVIQSDDTPSVQTIKKTLEEGKEGISYCMLLLPPKVGGINKDGIVDKRSVGVKEIRADLMDVADITSPALPNAPESDVDMYNPNGRRRFLLTTRDGDTQVKEFIENKLGNSKALEEWESENKNLTVMDFRIDEIDDGPDATVAETLRYCHKVAEHKPHRTNEQTIEGHNKSTEYHTKELARSLQLPEDITRSLTAAARHHDDGKADPHWQRCMHVSPGRLLAKTGHNKRSLPMGGFRHEFISAMNAERNGVDDLALHLIASHHKDSRPYFLRNAAASSRDTNSKNQADVDRAYRVGEILDVNKDARTDDQTIVDFATRYVKLTNKYGSWALAYLEAIFKASDWRAEGDTNG